MLAGKLQVVFLQFVFAFAKYISGKGNLKFIKVLVVRFKGPAQSLSLSFANPRVVVIVSNYAVSAPQVWLGLVASGKASPATATSRGQTARVSGDWDERRIPRIHHTQHRMDVASYQQPASK